jgi:hypothetical protein
MNEKIDFETFFKNYCKGKKFKPLQCQIDMAKRLQKGERFIFSFPRRYSLNTYRKLLDEALEKYK